MKAVYCPYCGGRTKRNGRTSSGYCAWKSRPPSASFVADMVTFSYLNPNYLPYSCTNLAGISGLGNLLGVRSMGYAFSSCTFATIDFRGIDPSRLTNLSARSWGIHT